ncbi:MAG: NAD(P)-dependent oxidoreductase [Gemmatimonadetes bacterium]|nr:NAD(P)-dependent oxidoreductase [Gemmatimonadota bacterium]MDE3259449.1 NAD(P)-dependent oxidoreductase [Gemmatimonadota bacterium]
MRVLATGATGRIGQHLVRALTDAGHAVRALVMPNDNKAAKLAANVEVVFGRLEEPASLGPAVDGVDAVFHLAGALTSRGCREEEFVRVNVQGTFRLLKAVRDQTRKPAHFVYASSDAVYFEKPDEDARYLPVDEDYPLMSGSVYGASKIGAEELCWSFSRGFGIPVTVLRFGATADAMELVDPNSVFARWLFLRAAIAHTGATAAANGAQSKTRAALKSLDTGGEQLVVYADCDGNPEVRQWADARDIAAGCLRVLGAEVAVGKAFNMGGREPHCAEAFVDFLAARLELPHVKACIPTARRPWFITSGMAERLLGYEARYSVYDMVEDAIQMRETPV